jgi:quercetin 2,3-dioxygenase
MIREPIVAYGPFVMNRRDEIIEAMADYRRGAFGKIP